MNSARRPGDGLVGARADHRSQVDGDRGLGLVGREAVIGRMENFGVMFGAACGLGIAQSCLLVRLDLPFDVKPQFVIDLAIDGGPAEDGPESNH